MKKSFDKRTFPRIRTPKLVIDYKIKETEQVYKAELLDVSAGGLGFLRNAIISKNDVLIIKFPFKTQKILLTGQVIRLDGREVGVRFENPDSEIEKFVETFNDEYSYLLKSAPESDAREFKDFGTGGGPTEKTIDELLDPEKD
ncbi:MAG TPA: PilZ domain-containing protein [Spirochaetes bacterium]|nr:PilZ domain-containing protein [Spirochaetota bacterium]